MAEPVATDDADSGVGALYHREYLTLVRMATLLLGDVESAEDAVQEAFAELHRRWPRLREPERAGGYLRRAVVNQARSQMRRRGTATRAIPRLAATDDGGDTTAEVSLGNARRVAVVAALATLPRRQREVLVLRHYLDLPEAEIARTLGIGRGSVKTHASRGAATLRTLLEEER